MNQNQVATPEHDTPAEQLADQLADHLADQEADRAALATYRPATDLFVDDERFVWMVDLPGVTAESLDIEVVDRHLVVDATDSAGELRYQRRFEVPDAADLAQVDADLQRGQLRIEVRKRAELRPRKIALKSDA